jgi:CheY-like chemotaxis protein
MAAERGRCTPRIILVVDDNQGMRDLIVTLLELDRPDDLVVTAGTVKDAIAEWRKVKPSVVVLDEMLGSGVSGVDEVAAPMLRELPGTPVVLFSAYLHDDLRKRAENAGVTMCLAQDDIRQLPDIVGELGES